MVVGQTIAAAGALVAAAAVGLASFALLLVALFVLGFGNSADRLARYAAADVSQPDRRGSAIAFIVWAGTIGAVVGPALLEPSQRGAEWLGLAGLAGPYLLAAGSFAVAGLVVFALLRPDPLAFAADERRDVGVAGTPLSVLFAVPAVRIAIVALVVGQVVMVLIMTMTPIHIRDAGQSLGAVGLVISAHTLGMFALSPLTGWLIDRLGRIPVIVAGQALFIISGLMAVFASGDDRVLLVTALFLLGLGWNFGFVAGSALVVEGVAPANRLRMQGVTDGFVWTSAAAASLFSGFVLAAGGYPAVGLVGAAFAIIPLTVIVLQARSV
jgi:MFS family permease